ncbi:acylneuraminate cytidylyltransferase family protein [Polynucleobacter paneuropaeus]|nr:acylneuraminate cytidylyltransferase family protein [Polynucleobacter paneuropaeus]
MKRLCTICARGGSKGVKGKNLKLLLGKPLIVHSIEQARNSKLFDLISVSSDSPEILSIAKEWGVEYLIDRPAEMATDQAGKLPAIQHCASEVEKLSNTRFDTFVDLDATSPLRIAEDIIGAVNLLEASGTDNVITATPARRSPYFNLVEEDVNGIVHLSKPLIQPVLRRQDAPKCFDMNASIYGWNRIGMFEKNTIFNPTTRLYVMPEDRSIDIDSELDFELVEFLFSKRV